MKGLELSRGFYREFGEPMLKEKFPELLPLIAVGLCGAGSECFGYDDEVSRDHDFEPGFCIFLPPEEIVGRREAFLLEREYSRLPREYGGLKRSIVNPVGGARHGVFRTADYFTARAGTPDGRLTLEEWLTVPEYALAEAVNGEVFYDGYGEFSAVRERLSRYPGDVRLKKLAGRLLLAAQAGQYNYPRCLRHGETGAARLALFEFVQNAMRSMFLLDGRYMPYYKWSFRALGESKDFAPAATKLEELLSSRSDGEAERIEELCSELIRKLKTDGLSSAESGDLETHAYAVNEKITDKPLRAMNILAAV